MVDAADKTPKNKPCVVICSAGGLHAGDLAALLVREFQVERVMTLPGLKQVMRRPVQALIIFPVGSHFCWLDTPEIADLINQWKTRVLVIGAGGDPRMERSSKQIKFFAEVPDCQTIVDALGGLVPLEGEAF